MVYKIKNILRFISNFIRLRNKNLSWKMLRYQQYEIEVEIDDNVKTKFRVYRNTKNGEVLSTTQIFRSVESAELFITKAVHRSAHISILKRNRLYNRILEW